MNAFTLDYCASKIKIFYSYLQHYEARLQGIAWLYFNHIDLFYKLRYLFGTSEIIWPVVQNLGFCPQVLGFQDLTA